MEEIFLAKIQCKHIYKYHNASHLYNYYILIKFKKKFKNQQYATIIDISHLMKRSLEHKRISNVPGARHKNISSHIIAIRSSAILNPNIISF
jgi:NurA-like 5'-3' nuclease